MSHSDNDLYGLYIIGNEFDMLRISKGFQSGQKCRNDARDLWLIRPAAMLHTSELVADRLVLVLFELVSQVQSEATPCHVEMGVCHRLERCK